MRALACGEDSVRAQLDVRTALGRAAGVTAVILLAGLATALWASGVGRAVPVSLGRAAMDVVTPAGTVRLSAPTGTSATVLHTRAGVLVRVTGDATVHRASVARDLGIEASGDLRVLPGVLRAGRDLTLGAGGVLSVRDTTQAPVHLYAARDLRLHGETVTLSVLRSGGSAVTARRHLHVRSAEAAVLDAHLHAGGRVQMQDARGAPGSAMSVDDPIVLAGGDVSMGNYVGASLHVLAGGAVSLGNVTITGLDTTANTVGPGNLATFNGTSTYAALASVIMSDGTPVAVDGSARATLDVRAGIDWTTFPGGAPGNTTVGGGVAPAFGATSSAEISTGSIVIDAPAGMVLLTNQYAPSGSLAGGIFVGGTLTASRTDGTSAGTVLVDSRAQAQGSSVLASASVADTSTAGTGGQARLLATGPLSFGIINVASSAPAGTARDAGSVVVRSGGSTTVSGISAFSRGAVESGHGGDVLVEGSAPLITGTITTSATHGGEGASGDAGDVTVTVTGSGDAQINQVNAQSGLGGDAGATGSAGDGGAISVTVDDGDLVVVQWLWAQTHARGAGHPAGSGGDVTLSVPAGAVSVGAFGINTATTAMAAPAGDGGTVTVTARDDVTIGDGGVILGVFTRAQVTGDGPAGHAGAITLTSATGTLHTRQLLATSSAVSSTTGTAGNGGAVTLTAAGPITADLVHTFATAPAGSGNAGAITIDTAATLTLTASPTLTASSTSSTGPSGHGGAVTVTTGGLSSTLNVTTGSHAATTTGNGGAITIDTTAPATLGQLDSRTRHTSTGASGHAGDISVHARGSGDLVLTHAWAHAGLGNDAGATGSAGDGGAISVTVDDGDLVVVQWLWAQTHARGAGHPAGSGGDVTLSVPAGAVSVGAFGINTATTAMAAPAGDGGTVTVTARDDVTIGDGGVILGVFTRAQVTGDGPAGHAGAITLTSATGTLHTRQLLATSSAVSSTTGTAGNGGAVTLTAAGPITADLVHTFATAPAGSGNAGAITIDTAATLTLTASPTLTASSTSSTGPSGHGGAVTVTTGGLSSTLNVTTGSHAATTTGNGGAITIDTTAPATLGQLDSRTRHTSTGASGHAGDISVTVTGSGDTFIEQVHAPSGLDDAPDATGPAGDGGNVTITVADGDLVIDQHVWTPTVARGAGHPAGNGGDVTLSVPAGAVSVGAFGINTATTTPDGGSTGTGGTVLVEAAEGVRIASTLPTAVRTSGAPAGSLTIRHGGGGITPFVVGDPSTNGTSGALEAGDTVITETQSFLYTHVDPPIRIESVPWPLTSALHVEAGTDPLAWDDTVAVTLTAGNAGAADATATTLAFDVPDGLTVDELVDPPDGTEVEEGTVQWTGTVPAGHEVVLHVVLRNRAASTTTATLTARMTRPASEHDDDHEAALDLIGAPAAVLDPAAVDFGGVAVDQPAAARTVTLTNPGPSPLAIADIAASGDYSATDDCPGVLSAAAACTITVGFTPTATGPRPGTLTVTSNAPDSPAAGTLTGLGRAPFVLDLTLVVGAHDPVPWDAEVNVRLTATNHGATPASGATLSMSLPEELAFDRFTGPETGATAAGGTVSWTGVVPADGAFTLNAVLRNRARATGPVTLTAALNHDGSGTAVERTGAPQQLIGAPVLTPTPAALDFGPQRVRQPSTSRTVTLTNTGASTVTFDEVHADGDYDASSTCPSTLAPGGSCTVSVRFTPIVTGVRTGTLTVTSSAPDSPTTVTLVGEGRSPEVLRVFGASRFGTAAALSAGRFSPGVDVVYLATGSNFPDALTGGVAAALTEAPILLVTRATVPEETASELERLRPGSIVLLGGTGVIGPEVAIALERFTTGQVRRIAGADRFATAAAVSAATFPAGAATVYIATGANFPDALTGVVAAAEAAGPLLLVNRDGIPAATESELARLGPSEVVILGGAGAVGAEVEGSLRRFGAVRRIAGPSRFATAAALAADAFTDGAATVYVATGGNFPDAVAGGAIAALVPAPVLLSTTGDLTDATRAELLRLAPTRVVILGGNAVVGPDVEAELRRLVGAG
jgi:putative cell wall-binding protein